MVSPLIPEKHSDSYIPPRMGDGLFKGGQQFLFFHCGVISDGIELYTLTFIDSAKIIRFHLHSNAQLRLLVVYHVSYGRTIVLSLVITQSRWMNSQPEKLRVIPAHVD